MSIYKEIRKSYLVKICISYLQFKFRFKDLNIENINIVSDFEPMDLLQKQVFSHQVNL